MYMYVIAIRTQPKLYSFPISSLILSILLIGMGLVIKYAMNAEESQGYLLWLLSMPYIKI